MDPSAAVSAGAPAAKMLRTGNLSGHFPTQNASTKNFSVGIFFRGKNIYIYIYIYTYFNKIPGEFCW